MSKSILVIDTPDYCSECPYYGIPVQQHSGSGGWRTVIEPKCRRCET